MLKNCYICLRSPRWAARKSAEMLNEASWNRERCYSLRFSRGALYFSSSQTRITRNEQSKAWVEVWEGLLVVTTKREIRVKPPWKWLCMEYASHDAASSSVNKETRQEAHSAAGSLHCGGSITNNKCTELGGRLKMHGKFMTKLLFLTFFKQLPWYLYSIWNRMYNR